MPSDFHWDMDRYLTNRRRKKIFSGLKSKVMNKKAVVSYRAANKFGELKGKVLSKVRGIKKTGEEPKKEITQEEINKLVEKKGIKSEPGEKTEQMPVAHSPDVTKVEDKVASKTEAVKPQKKEENEGEGWKEVKLPSAEKEEQKLTNLEEDKKRLQENLVKIQEKGRAEKERIAKFGGENEQRAKAEPEQDRAKRLKLEEEINVLKEKERIEEDRLAELRKARRREQMESLRGRVTDILFKKRLKKSKDMVEEVRKEIRMEARVGEAERQKVEVNGIEVLSPVPRALRNKVPNSSSKAREKPEDSKNPFGIKELGGPKEDVAKVEDEKIGEVTKKEEAPKVEEKPKEDVTKTEEKKPKKSFLSRFIQIKTAAQIAKEEEERLKEEEEQALKDQSDIDNVLEGGGEVKASPPAEEQDVNLSTLFPTKGEVEQKEEKQEDITDLGNKEDTIDLGKDYKIKVVKN